MEVDGGAAGKENEAVSNNIVLGQPPAPAPPPPQDEVTLNHLSRRMAEFAADREWDQFHSPRNLLLALVILDSLPFRFFSSSPSYVSSANHSVGEWLVGWLGGGARGSTWFGCFIGLPVDSDLSLHAVWRSYWPPTLFVNESWCFGGSRSILG